MRGDECATTHHMPALIMHPVVVSRAVKSNHANPGNPPQCCGMPTSAFTGSVPTPTETLPLRLADTPPESDGNETHLGGASHYCNSRICAEHVSLLTAKEEPAVLIFILQGPQGNAVVIGNCEKLVLQWDNTSHGGWGEVWTGGYYWHPHPPHVHAKRSCYASSSSSSSWMHGKVHCPCHPVCTVCCAHHTP